MTADEINALVLHRDGVMLILDKPAGLPVHRGPKGGASLMDDFDHLRFGLPRAPELAHRLDRETSGCLVLGRHRKALERLGKLFKAGEVKKTYWALVEGGPQAEEGEIDLALARRDPERGWWMKVDPAGLPSRSTWRVMGCGEIDGRAVAWLALSPLTGRTHQLRVHCAAMGFPIVGDQIYGGAPRSLAPTLMLHSRSIVVPYGKTTPAVEVTAPVPQAMAAGLAACGWRGEGAAPSPAVATPSAAP
jgi:tRNA pseudouridine32 synthase/23S rRNA pseudouridine746 synthase